VSDVLKQLQDYADDTSIKAIVLRIDSPGGAVGPSQEVYAAVNRAKSQKPVVSSMGAVAASGGLYAAMSSSKVFAQPGTLTGSIGVIMQIPNFSELSSKVGVSVITLKSGDLKDAGNSFRPMTESEAQYLTETAKKVHEQFIRDISLGRNLDISKVRSFADGRVLTGEDAKTLGLVDEFGDMYDAARSALSLIEINEKPVLIEKRKPFQELKDIFQGAKSLVNSLIPQFSSSILLVSR
jgi:protease-4